MNDMVQFTQFTFEGWNLNVIYRDGHPWWILHEVCRLLDLGNSREVSSRLDDDEKGTIGNVISNDIHPNTTIINESGLYNVILTCRKENAKRFKKWVTAEVLPSIRKTGSYGTPSAIDYSDPVHVIGVIQSFQAQLAAKDKVIEAAKPKVEFVDRHANGEGCYNLQTASQLIGLTSNKLSALLQQNRFLHKQNSNLRPYTEFMQEPRCYFYLKTSVQTDVNGVDHARHQAMVTPKGLQFFAKKFGKSPLQSDGLFGGIA
jgi:anti-repressor protein